jgi:hypothetical protein
MVSLAIADTLSPNKNSNKTISLRDNAIWFPRIPEDYLQLNKSQVKSTNTATFGFRPMCCLFSESTNPARILKVSVTLQADSFETLVLYCHYDTGDIRKLGPSYNTIDTTKPEGYTLKCTARGDKDIYTFVKNGDLQPPLVSNYSKRLLSDGLNTQIS